MQRFAIGCLLFLLPIILIAQDVIPVQGTFVYYAEEWQSIVDSKSSALEGARIEALRRAFGTSVSQRTVQSDTWADGKESSFFSQMSDSEVKGEWIEDVGEPVYDVSIVDGMMVVKCSVRGKARSFSNEAVDFEATILRNGIEERFADADFKAGDDIYLRFRAPIDGFVAVYLVDESLTANCLLPYKKDTDGQYQVKGGKDYVFFSEKMALPGEAVDEYSLWCNGLREQNQVYVIFSPEPFTKATDYQYFNESIELTRQLPYKDFSRWLGARRRRDARMNVKIIQISITKQL